MSAAADAIHERLKARRARRGRSPRRRRHLLPPESRAVGRAAAAPRAPSRSAGHERPADRRSRHDDRSVQLDRPGQHTEPPADLHLRRDCRSRIRATLAPGERRAHGRSSRAWPASATAAGDRIRPRPSDGALSGGRAEGSTFDAGVEQALRLILASPKFLFRVETPPAAAGVGRSLTWSLPRASVLPVELDPDDELLKIAEQGRLDQPAVLRAQVERMLKDPKARALVDSFATQWLRLRNLRSHTRSRATFPTSTTSCARRSDRDRAVLREHHPRGPERARSAERGLHLRERAAGAPLRHPQRAYGHFRRVTCNRTRAAASSDRAAS